MYVNTIILFLIVISVSTSCHKLLDSNAQSSLKLDTTSFIKRLLRHRNNNLCSSNNSVASINKFCKNNCIQILYWYTVFTTAEGERRFHNVCNLFNWSVEMPGEQPQGEHCQMVDDDTLCLNDGNVIFTGNDDVTLDAGIFWAGKCIQGPYVPCWGLFARRSLPWR